MEYSSPLAAMRPHPCPAWGNRKDLPMPRSYCNGYQTFGPNSFNFKDLSMFQQPKPAPAPAQDYFSARPARGSSPTSSLTADLDANFHIDKSPQCPTPRRSLFQTNVFQPHDGDLVTPPIMLDRATTPPVPSSSPCGDMMDISPLPHKPPYFKAQITLPSPTPEQTPDEECYISPDLLSPQEPPTPIQAPALDLPAAIALPERRRPVTRPSLTRKGYSSNQVPQRPVSAEESLPPFRFGNVATHGIASSSTPSLDRYTDSPAEATTPTSGCSMLPPARRPSLSNVNRANGSPSTGHVRKPPAGRPAFVRPQRKIMRRSLSMFQHPDDIMREEEEAFESPSGLASIMDVDQDHQPILPHFISSEEPDGLPRISQETLIDVLENKYNSHYDRIKIIDCRFEYEYSGGHIEHAINRNDKHDLATELFASHDSSSTLIVFHCEYSVHRAPLTAKFIRSHDRNVNAANYPRLTYPELYILDGGYSKFFANHTAKCYPQNYVEMSDQRHEQACERGMAKVKGRQKLFRAQTFAFGQNAHEDMEDSPTGQGRTFSGRSQSTLNVTADKGEGIGQSFARRIASY